MSKKSSLSSRLISPSSGDISSSSFFQEEISDLILSRRVDLQNINHLQTLSGHMFDILKSLSELLETTFQRLENSCRNFSINPSLVCESLFLAVCRYYLSKAENYDKTKLKLADENSIRQLESYDLLRFALEIYLKLTKNSIQNSRARKTSSQRKSGDHINEDGSIFEIRTIRIEKMSRFMWHFYNKLKFERWFTISKPDIQNLTGYDRKDDNLQDDFTALVDERSHDNGFQFIYSIVSYYTKTCISVADRAFLNEIYVDFRDEACVIHGSSYYKPHSLDRIFKLPGNRSPGKMKNSKNKKDIMSGSVDLCLQKSYDKKMKNALRWLNNLPEKSRLLIIACTEEELISLAFNLRNEFSVEEIYYFCCGLVGLSKKNAWALDTKLFKPDRCSETMEKLPVNTASVSMFTYGDFLQRFFPQGKNGNAAKGEIILSNVLLWGVPDGGTANKDGYRRILKFLRDNKIPALAVPGAAENNSSKYFNMEETHRKEKEIHNTDYPTVPVLSRIDYEILDNNYKLNSDFAATILKNHRTGLNQIILGPNSLYVQKLYYELKNIFVDNRCPVKNLELYHSMFGLLDKHAKRQKIVNMINKGGALVVSTLNFFPDLISEFPLIFIEGLPFERCLLTLLDSMKSIVPEKKVKSSPQIFWSVAKARGKESNSLMDDIVEGNITAEKIWRMSDSMQENNTQLEQLYNIEENQILVPYCSITENRYVNIANRFIVPDYLAGKLSGYKKSYNSENIYISGAEENVSLGIHPRQETPAWRYMECILPYNSKLGLIGPPQWIDKFMP